MSGEGLGTHLALLPRVWDSPRSAQVICETGLVVSWNWPSQWLVVTKLFTTLSSSSLSWTGYRNKGVQG